MLMKKKLSNFLYYTLPLGFLLAAFILLVISELPPIFPLHSGRPTIVYEECEPLGELTDVAAGSDRLYLLYNRKQVVKAYTADGTYLYSILFPNNQRSSIYASEEDLYFIDHTSKVSKVFHYRSDVLQSVQHLSEYPEEIQQQIRDNAGFYGAPEYTASLPYRIVGLDVVYTAADGTTHTVVDRPLWLYLFHTGIIRRVYFTTFALLFIWAGTAQIRKTRAACRPYSSLKKSELKKIDSLW